MWLSSPALTFVASVGIHALIARVWPRESRVLTFLAVGVIAGSLMTSFLLLRYGADTHTLAGTCGYALLCELYVFSFTLTMNSLSATMMLALMQGPLRERDLAVSFGGAEMVRARVRDLTATALLEGCGDDLCPTASGRRLLRSFVRLRGFFGL
jgi:hypothetical protein